MRISIIAAAIVFCSLFAAGASAAPLYKIEDCGKYDAQMDLTACSGRNYDTADTTLNALYKKIMTQQDSQQSKDQLKGVERTWIAYRDQECAFELGPQEEGGSIWPMDMNDCMRGKTDARIRELQTMVQ